jgi:type IV secretory pathway VirD2 relaxase
MNEFDEEFLLRPGRVGQDRTIRPAGFLTEVRTAAVRASDPGSSPRRGGARRGARGAARANPSPAAARRVMVKARIVRHAGARYRAAPLSRHIAYLEREGVSADGARPRMFDAGGERADIEAFAARCEGDRHHFRFIVSPEDAGAMSDLRAFSRALMTTAEQDLGTRLDWVAIDHWNTDNPHLHILVRGKAQDGADLVIAGDYIAQGLRGRAQALVSLELGPRSQQEILAALATEIGADRWTSLDRDLVRAAINKGDPLAGADRQADHRQRLLGRLGHLQRLGLADETRPGAWRLAEGLETRLRDLGLKGDIIKTLHRAAARQGAGVDPRRFEIQPDEATTPVAGRLLDRGLRDELAGSAYVIIDGLDGRQHHLGFRDLADTSDAPLGAIVEVRRLGEGLQGRRLMVRSDLDLVAQVTASGATWLDRRLIAADLSSNVGGFAKEAAEATQQRLQILIERGLAEARGGRARLAPNLLARLDAAERSELVARIERETGLTHRLSAPGESVAGRYQRRYDLASGRLAMLEDGLGFRLVPWSPRLENHLGRQVAGRMIPGSRIEWSLGRARGLGL